jgi:hypothetical protein
MSSQDRLTERLKTRISELSDFLQWTDEETVYIVEYKKDSTAHILTNINRNKAWIDINGSCKSIFFDEDKVFTIRHSQPIEILFIPIDGQHGLCKGDACDFVFCNDVAFCFVELKLNATSEQDSAIDRNRTKAVDQLQKTIAYFDSHTNSNYEGLKQEAYIATPDIYPRENAAFENIRVKFLETNRIQLYETRSYPPSRE